MSNGDMEHYKKVVHEMHIALNQLVDAVIEHFDTLPKEEITIPLREGMLVRLERAVGLIKTAPPVRIELGVRFVPQGNPRARFIACGRSGRGVIIAEMVAFKSHTYEAFFPDGFIDTVLTDHRWESLDIVVQGFLGTYEAIAKLLPEEHELQRRTAELRTSLSKIAPRLRVV